MTSSNISGAEIGPNDIIIHLVNPFKCLDCGTEFFHRNSFLQHLAEHMEKLKVQHPCYQIVCSVNLAAQQPSSITVTKDILQINENQMFELQDTSLDYTKLTPLKTLEQAGILHLPPSEKVLSPALPKLHNSQTLGMNLVAQNVLQGLSHQNIVTIQQGGNPGAIDILGKLLNEKSLSSTISLNNVQHLQADETTAEELQIFVQQALMGNNAIKEELNSGMNSSEGDGIHRTNDSSVPLEVVPKIDISKENGSLLNIDAVPLTEGNHMMIFNDVPNTNGQMGEKRFQCKVCWNKFVSEDGLTRHQVIHSGEKALSCFRCFKQFKDISSLTKHSKIHKRCHKCPVCLKTFLRRNQMELHLSQHKKKRFIQFGNKYHEVQVSTSRNTDDQIIHEFSLSSLLDNIPSRNIPNKDGEQENISLDNKTVEGMMVDGHDSRKTEKKFTEDSSHQIQALNDRKFPDGPKSLENIKKPHKILSSHKVIYQCGHCQKLINTRPTLSRHLMLHTNEKPYQCEHCRKSFRHKSDLLHHYKTHSKPMKCFTCGSAFSKELYLHNHVKKGCPFLESDNEKFVVLPDLTYKCNLCSKSLKTKANVVRHLRIHAFVNKESDSKKISKKKIIDVTKDSSNSTMSTNVDDYIKPLDNSVGFLCTICNEQFRFKSFMLVHVRMHLGQRSFKCKECGKGFYGRHILRKHQQNHTRPYKCPHCGKGFNRRYLMAHHYNKSHNDEAENKMKDITFLAEDKLLCCDICGKTMKSYQKSLMQYHIRLHKDVRPHQCKVCEKTFISDIALKKHSLNHSKPYLCQVCNRGFSRRYLMLDHFERKCKYKLQEKKQHLVHEDCKATGTDISDKNEDATENPVLLSKAENEIGGKSLKTPFRAEVVTERDETKGTQVFRCVPCDKMFSLQDAVARHIKTFMKMTSCKYCKCDFEDKHLTLAHQRSCLGVDISGVKSPSSSLKAMGEKQEKVQRTMKAMSSKIHSLTSAMLSTTTDVQETGCVQQAKEVENTLPAPCSGIKSSSCVESIEDVTKRTIAILKKDDTYQCPECEKSFNTARGLKIHAASHVRLYKCDTCNQDFTKVGKFRFHLQSHAKDERGSKDSNTIDIDSNVSPSLSEHIEKDRGATAKISSNIMKQSDMSKSDIDNEDERNEQGKDKDKNERRENTEGNEDESSIETPPRLKIENVSLRLMQSGTRGRPFSCKMCRKRYTEESSLQLHMTSFHA